VRLKQLDALLRLRLTTRKLFFQADY